MLPRKKGSTLIFVLGLLLALFGIGGWAYFQFFVSEDWVPRFSDEVVALGKIDTKKLVDLPSQQSQFEEILPSFVPFEAEKLASWIGRDVYFGFLESGSSFGVFSISNKEALVTFVENQVPSGDSFSKTEKGDGELWTPGFSSTQGFWILDRHLVWIENVDFLDELLVKEPGNRLIDTSEFKRFYNPNTAADIGFLYMNSSSLDLDSPKVSPEYREFLVAFTKAVPLMGFYFDEVNGNLEMNLKLFSDLDLGVADVTPGSAPYSELLSWVPDSVLYASTGLDLAAQYDLTETSLKKVNPRLEIVFAGLIQKRFTSIFGNQNDWKTDFLDLLKGEYLYGFNEEIGAQFFMITDLRQLPNPQETLQSWQSTFQAAQARMSPKIETVEMPDGTTREEVVASSSRDVPVLPKSEGIYTYYLSPGVSKNQQFVYGLIDDYFVFAVGEDTFLKILKQKTGSSYEPSLSEDLNNHFAPSISASRGLTYLNYERLWPLLDRQSENPDEIPAWRRYIPSTLSSVWIERTLGSEGFNFRFWVR